MLTLSGAGDFANTNNLTLNDPASSLKLNGISEVQKVSISAGLTSGKLEIAENSTIGVLTHTGSSRIDIDNSKVLTLSNAFEIPSSQSMELVGTDNGTLVLGNQLTLSGILKFSAPDTLSNGTLALNGGTLDVSKDASISSALLHEASSEVSVSTGETLTYSGSALDIGALTLTLSGGGTFANSTDLRFNDTASVLNFGGIAEVSKVSFPVSLQTGKLNVTQNAKIQTLTHSGESIINISSGKILTIAEGFTIGSSKSMVLNGAGGNLKLENTMTLSGTLQMDEQSTLNSGTLAFDGGIVSVNNNSTISSAITHAGPSTFEIASGKRLTMKSDFTVPASKKMSLTGSNGVLDLQNTLTLSGTLEFAVPQTLDNGTLALNGGTLSVKDNVTISSAIAHSLDSTVDISSGSTLTHSGGALNIGAKTLTLSGGGTFANVDQLVLNDVGGELEFSGTSATTTVSHVKISSGDTSNAPTLKISSNGVIQNLAHEEFSEINFASGKTLSVEQAFEVPYGKQMTITGAAGTLTLGDNMSLTGTLNLAVEDAILSSGSLTLNGGLLEVSEDASISSAVIQKLSSEFSVATGKTLSYTGSSFDISAYTLTLSGGGNFQSGGLDLNNANSKLLLNSITVDNVSTTVDNSLGVDVDNDSTITSLSVANITPVSIANTKTLSGAITVTAGSIKLAETGTLASSISMSGGVLDADNSLTVSGALTQSGNITIDVLTDKTLTYSGTAISLGATTLTLSGGGSLVSGGLTLNDASSKLLLNSITVDNVSTTSDSLGLDVDNNSTITALSVGHITPVSIASSKSLSGAITVTAGSLKLTEAGTLASSVSMSGGVLDADESSTVSGVLSHTADITIDVADNKTLTYSGAAISLGANTLTLSGGGSLVSGGLTLNNADSKLLLNSITLDNVSTSANSLGIDVDNNSTITSLSVANITPVSIASGKSLSGAITVTAGSLKLNETGTLASTVTMSGGKLDADETSTVSGALTQSGDITIDVATGKTLTYSGAAVNLGAKTLTLSGGGTLGNTNALVLNNANSKLLLNSITVGQCKYFCRQFRS